MLRDRDKESDLSLTIGPQCRGQTPKQLIKTKALISIVGNVPSTVGKTETETISLPLGKEENVS